MDKFIPKNEQGVVTLFGYLHRDTDWTIESIQTDFPDAILSRNGEIWRVEFEFRSLNFRAHGHNVLDADLIICWKHDWNDCPLPVIELSNPNFSNIEIRKATDKGKYIYTKRKSARKPHKNLENQRFGRLLVLEETILRYSGKPTYICLCDCGKYTTVNSQHLRRGYTKSCGCLRRDNAKEMFTGDKNYNWREELHQ